MMDETQAGASNCNELIWDLPICRFADFLLSAGALKRLPRTGWKLAGIANCESVADHCYRVVLLAMMLAEMVEGVDGEKLLRMAILHDLPESVVTDLPRATVEIIGREEKRRVEREAWTRLLPPGRTLENWRALWDEYQAGETLEARLVRAADRLEMLFQAYEYQRTGYRDLDDFWREEDIEDHGFKAVRALVEELKRRRARL